MTYFQRHPFISLITIGSLVAVTGSPLLARHVPANSQPVFLSRAQLVEPFLDSHLQHGQKAPSRRINHLASMGEIDEASLADTALKVPAVTLLEGYQVVQTLFSWLPMAENGMTIQTPTQTIGPHNAQKVRIELEKKLAIYEAAIQERGYSTISGKYDTKATPACEQIHSAWADAMAKGMIESVTIEQEQFTLNLIHLLETEDKQMTAELPGTIVESTFLFSDPMNSDFSFIGQVTPQEITIRPNVEEILAAWPTAFGFKPPSEENLSNCEATLTPILEVSER